MLLDTHKSDRQQNKKGLQLSKVARIARFRLKLFILYTELYDTVCKSK